MKEALFEMVTDIVAKQPGTQKEIAKSLGIPQSRVCGLMNDGPELFSNNFLFDILLRLGYDVGINVTKTKKKQGEITIRGPEDL